MALVVKDRVKEATTTTGTGTISLDGAATGFQTFVAGIGTTNTTYYAIVDNNTGDYEVGIGTITDATPDTLSRDTILESSNAGSAVNLQAGTKDVFCTYPAEKSVYLDSSGQLVLDGTAITATASELNFVDGVTSSIQTQIDSFANSLEGVKNDYVYTATASQTVFSGADDNTNTLVIDLAGLVNVFLNGVRLIRDTDYTVSAAGDSITLTTGASVNDLLEVEVFGNFTGQSGAEVGITGGLIDGVDIGNTTAGDGTFVDLTTTGTTTLGGTLDTNGNAIIGTSVAINASNGDLMINATEDGPVSLRYDGNLKLSTKSDGVNITGELEADSLDIDGDGDISGNLTLGGNLNLGDNDKAIFGAGSDLQIYHNGSNSYIDELGTGDLFVRASDDLRLQVRNDTDTAWASSVICNDGGETSLHFNGVKRIATTNTGIDVTGTVTADGLTVDGAGSFSTNLSIRTTSSPNGYNLHVSQDDSDKALAKFTNTTTGTTTSDGFDVGINAVEEALLFHNENKPIRFGTNGTDRLRIENNGDISFYDTSANDAFYWDATNARLGIGTGSSPNSLLHLASSSPLITFTDTDNSAYAHVSMGSFGGLAFNADVGNTRPATDIKFLVDNTERMSIDSSGNVGIGTSSPSDRLEVKGATGTGVIVISSGDTTLTGNDVIGQLNFKDYDADAHVGGDQDDVVNIKAIALHESGGATAFDGSTNEGYALSFSTSKRPSANAAFTVSEAMRIDSSGNVGIGTADPQEQIHSYASGSNALRVSGNANNNQKVEIGYDTTNGPYIKAGSSGVTGLQFYVDNTALAATIGSTGVLMVGTTDTFPGNGDTNTGFAVQQSGNAAFSADDNRSLFNRNNSDGDILAFHKDGVKVGSIESKNGDSIGINLYPAGNIGVRGVPNALVPFGNGSDRDATTDLGRVAHRFRHGYFSGGVYLGGTGSANHLDDYEEGTFDPTVGGVDSGSGFYRKIGDLIFIEIVLTTNSISTDTIGGLPFNISSASGYGGLLFGRMTNCDVLDSNGVPCRMNFSFATIEFRQNSLNASDGSFTITSPASGTVRIGISGVGRVF